MPRLADLELGTEVLKPFSFKRKRRDGTEVDCHVAIRLLTPHELATAKMNAEIYVNSLAPNEKTTSDTREDLIKDAQIDEVLSIALRDPEKPEQPWAAPIELRKKLTAVEVGLLWKVYEEHEQSCGSTYSELSEAQFNELLRAIAEEADTSPLLFLGFHARKNFIVTLASRHLSSLTGKSLPFSGELSSSNEGVSSTENGESEGLSEDQYEALLARVKSDLLELVRDIAPTASDE